MKKNLFFILFASLLAFTACNDDDSTTSTPVSVAFSVPSANLTEDATTVQILFSEPAPSAGFVTLTYNATAVTYGTDFTTLPAVEANKVVVPFEANATSTSFVFNKLIDAIEGQVKNVVFTISEVSFNATIEGNTTTQLNFNETASLGSALAAEVGGAMQPNQVYIDLSSGAMTTVPRVSWDLGFYSGSEFRVTLNSSVKMAVKQLETTDIDLVQAEDPSMLIGQGTGNGNQVDGPTGVITTTAIAEVSANDADNKVYLVNLGNNPATTPPALGSDGSGIGTHRGWKKVRILKSGNDYKIQYADINSTTHQEVTITKNAAYNFTFFSFTTNNTVNVEPQKNQWDLNFTTFVNVLGGTTPYYYADFVLTNLKGGAKAYQVMNTDFTYDNFTAANVVNANFTDNQTNIGSNWRTTSVTGNDGIPVAQFVLRTDRFFVIKDPAGNIYKLKFTGGASESGERGYPTFQYTLVQ